MMALGGTITVEAHTRATPEQVWAVLGDGWAYATWVVGAARVRSVDLDWPASGQRIHHSFGVWPALIHDTTEVLESVPHRKLTLTARGWPAGEATVQVTLEAEPTGSLITIAEDASSGPGQLVPKPVRQAFIAPRNRESLRRLTYLAEGRERGEVSQL